MKNRVNVNHIIASCLIVFFSIIFSHENSYAEKLDELYLKQVNTIKGEFKIIRNDINDTHRLLLNNKLLKEETDYNSIFINSVYPDTKNASIILLILGSGGTGCPAYYRIVDFTSKKDLHITNDFGNCSDLAKMEYVEGSILISMPDIYSGKDMLKWYYKSGVLTKVEKKTKEK